MPSLKNNCTLKTPNCYELLCYSFSDLSFFLLLQGNAIVVKKTASCKGAKLYLVYLRYARDQGTGHSLRQTKAQY